MPVDKKHKWMLLCECQKKKYMNNLCSKENVINKKSTNMSYETMTGGQS